MQPEPCPLHLQAWQRCCSAAAVLGRHLQLHRATEAALSAQAWARQWASQRLHRLHCGLHGVLPPCHLSCRRVSALRCRIEWLRPEAADRLDQSSIKLSRLDLVLSD